MASPSPGALMTLAGVAYGGPDRIPGYLASSLILGPDWSVVWIAQSQTRPVNFAYLARNAATGVVVAAIRGTYPNPFSPAYWDDGDQDSPFGEMVDWVPEAGSGAQVSGGTFQGFQNLLALVGADGRTLGAALEALPADADVWVVGHSLGGTLAPVLALWMTTITPPRTPSVASFAGMTPGNAAFAALFGHGAPLDGRVTRYFNTLDTVAYGWNDVLGTRSFYEPHPKGGLVVEAMLALTAARLTGYGYAAVGAPAPLQGVVRPPTIGCELVAYVLENLHQHMPDTYLTLLGAPPLPFTIGFGAVVAPRDATAAVDAPHALPVHYV